MRDGLLPAGSRREVRKKRWEHFGGKFLEYAYCTQDVSVAQVYHQQVEASKSPFGQYLYEAAEAERKRVTEPGADASQRSLDARLHFRG
jgi:hypothetical protein